MNDVCLLGDGEHERIPELYDVNDSDDSEDEDMEQQGHFLHLS